MNNQKLALTAHQVRQLAELGFSTYKYGSFFLYREQEKTELSTYVNSNFKLATLSVTDIIEVLIKNKRLNLSPYLGDKFPFDMIYKKGKWIVTFEYTWIARTTQTFEADELIDALFECLKWCIIEEKIVF